MLRKTGMALLLILLASAILSRAASSSATSTALSDLSQEAMTPTVVPRCRLPVVFKAYPLLPDLVVGMVRIELESGGRCDYTSTNLGTRVWIRNIGNADAGPFKVEVNGSEGSIAGLAADAVTDLWFAGYHWGTTTHAYADSAFEVAEISEDNNGFDEMVPIPTLPVPCTPTSTPTPTPTVTPTATRPPRT
jgi:hypothetical protein